MKFQSIALIIVAVCICLLSIFPLYKDTIAGTADGFAHKFRLVNFHNAVSEGILRPRWMAEAALGYGAPIFLFNYIVPYYIVDGLLRTGLSINDASSMYAALTMVASFSAMALLGSYLWGSLAGIVSAAIYTFAPYHLITVYSYEGWGEMLAFFFPPLLLFSILRMFDTVGQKKSLFIFFYSLATVTWVLFILSHNISSYMSAGFIVFISLIYAHRNRKKMAALGTLLCSTVLISAFFTFPAIFNLDSIRILALFEKEFALRGQYMVPITTQIVTSFQALSPSYKILYRDFTVGIPIFVALTFSALSTFASGVRNKNVWPYPLALLGVTVFTLFLVDPIFSPAYLFKPLRLVLYPYRFLFLATFLGSLLAGYVSRKSWVISGFFLILAVLFGTPFTKPSIDIFDFDDSFYSQPHYLGYAYPTLKTMGIAEFLPKTANIDFLVSQEQAYLENAVLPEKVFISDQKGRILQNEATNHSHIVTVQAYETIPVTWSTHYYPNWRASVDGVPVEIVPDTNGRITVVAPKGTHTIMLKFGYSMAEKLGIVITVLGGVFFIWSLRKLLR